MFGSVRYFLKEGIRNVYMNGLMSIASVLIMVCCLVMTGMGFVIYQNIKDALKEVEKKNSITVYLKYKTDVDLNQIKDQISSISNVESCTLYPKEEGIKKYQDLMGEAISSLFEGEDNPLPDAYKVSMKDLSCYDETVKQIMNIDEVDSISDKSDISKKLSDLKRLVTVVGFWVISGLASISLLIISNTIRITMYNRRFEISIMKSVGATNMFIRVPFIIEGLVLGLISAFLSMLLLHIICGRAISLINSIVPFSSLSLNDTYRQLLIIFISAGSFLGVFASMISIKKYLKKEGGMSVAW